MAIKPTMVPRWACLGILALVGCSASPQTDSVEAAAPVPDRTAAAETVPVTAPVASAPDAAHRAVAAALPFIEREGRAWMAGRVAVQEGAACVSCHQVPFALWGFGEARAAGIAAPPEEWSTLLDEALDFSLTRASGRPGLLSILLLAEDVGPAAAIDPARRAAMLERLRSEQRGDGRWPARGQFPSQRRSIDESDAVITMWSLLATRETSDAALLDSRQRAADWVESTADDVAAAERSTEWLVTRLLTADDVEQEALHAELDRRRNDDGGWGFLEGDESDAMTTGQVLYGLLVAGDGDPEIPDVLRRSVQYLVDTQNQDGSWTVPSRFFSHESSSDNDYVYDVWGTSWAVVGLARASSRIPGIS